MIFQVSQVVAAHMENEARGPDAVPPLYTDDAVLEIAARGLRFICRPESAASNRRTYGPCLAVDD